MPRWQSCKLPGTLVVRLCNWVGEVVLSVPSLRRLESAGYALHLVGKPWAPRLLAGTGWPVTVRASGLLAAARQMRALKAQLTSRDAAPALQALLMTKSLSSALETRLGGVPPVGYAYDGRSLLLSRAFPLPKLKHASFAYWQLVSDFLGVAAPYPTEVGLRPSGAQTHEAHAMLATHGLKPGAFCMLCPFSGADDREGRKVWPGFRALAEEFRARGIAVVVCPGSGEEAKSAALPGVITLAGLDLGVYAALLASARTVIANDTGPGHLAAAVGARLISIYGPSSSAAWAPLGSNVVLMHDAVWPSVERVVQASLETYP
jgi:heptosyltransferase II